MQYTLKANDKVVNLGKLDTYGVGHRTFALIRHVLTKTLYPGNTRKHIVSW